MSDDPDNDDTVRVERLLVALFDIGEDGLTLQDLPGTLEDVPPRSLWIVAGLFLDRGMIDHATKSAEIAGDRLDAMLGLTP